MALRINVLRACLGVCAMQVAAYSFGAGFSSGGVGEGAPPATPVLPADLQQYVNIYADTDNDGVLDSADAFPNDPSESVDTDGDGIGDNSDPYPTNYLPALAASPQDVSYGKNTALSIDLSQYFSDANSDLLTYSATGLPSGLTVVGSTLSGTPSVGSGNYTITVSAADAEGSISAEPFDLVITNAAPTVSAVPPNVSYGKSDSVSIDLSAYFTDSDSDSLTFSASGLPSGLSVDGAILSGTLSGPGSSTITITADDGEATIDTSFDLVATNASPSVSTVPAAQAVALSTAIAAIDLNAVFSDSDGDSLQYTVSGAPSGVGLNGASLEGTPTSGGTFTVTLQATDGYASESTSFVLSVQDASITGSSAHGYTTTGSNMIWYRKDKWDLTYSSISDLTYVITGNGCTFGGTVTTKTVASGTTVTAYKEPQSAVSDTSCDLAISNTSSVTENLTLQANIKRIEAKSDTTCALASSADLARSDTRVNNPFATVGTNNGYWMICRSDGCPYTATANGGQVWQVLDWPPYPSETIADARSGGASSLCKIGW